MFLGNAALVTITSSELNLWKRAGVPVLCSGTVVFLTVTQYVVDRTLIKG
jgi:hypothetical protein